MNSRPSRISLLIGVALALAMFPRTSPAASPVATKPVLLYSRCFNAAGETRYLPDGTFKDVIQRLGQNFEVRVSAEPLNRNVLKDVAVVLVANPNDVAVGTNPPPRHVVAVDVLEIRRYVNNGGGFIVMGNQEGHNVEVPHMNSLLGAFGLAFTNAYTDVKRLILPGTAPIIGGLRWGYYTGNQVLLRTNSPAKPRAVVVNDLSQKLLSGKRDVAGVLLAVSEPGKGRVVAVTDSGWISNDALSGKGIGGIGIKEQDNFEIVRRLARWAAHVDE
jgi:hypothetical protein